MRMTGQRWRDLSGLRACPYSPTRRNRLSPSAPLLQPSSLFFVSFIIHVRVTLTSQTVTSVAELHQSFSFRVLCVSEGERMGGISLDHGERERKKRVRQMMD